MSEFERLDSVAAVFVAGRRFLLGKSVSRGSSYFGGPGYDQVITGSRYGPRRLHHVLTLNHAEFGINALKFGFKTSFYYGIAFEGCELEWERTATAAINVTKMIPRKAEKDYPYFGYPDVLPYFPLEVIDVSDASSETISDAIYNTGWSIDPAKVYVVAHSHPNLGVALFEPGSDVDIVWECDPVAGRIRAANQMG